MARDNVLLVGFMGAGKSVCGRLLARRLGRCFVETDDIIVSRDGRSIPDIFRQDGEEAFRRLEGEVLDALALKSGDVIATGGGLPCRDDRVEALRALGTVVWLRGDLPELLERARRLGGHPCSSGRPRRSRRCTARASRTMRAPTSRWTRRGSASTRSSRGCSPR